MAAHGEERAARPLVGITGYLEPARWSDFVREAVLSPVTYSRAVERAGGIPVVLPPVPIDSVPQLVAGLDGILVCCGPDIDPRLYGSMRHEQTASSDRRRDTFDIALIRAAIDAGRPFLGVCRGMHVLNVVRGGSLIQHLPDAVGHERHQPDPVKMSAHDIQVSMSSRLGQVIGADASVPTRHHQGVQRLGTGLLAVAWADDQIVEAVELQGHPFGVGVQWHPEEDEDQRLIKEFVTAASAESRRLP
jgi:gamma-glutamyl-gamma-aminobutyrate hydrolase PuuD